MSAPAKPQIEKTTTVVPPPTAQTTELEKPYAEDNSSPSFGDKVKEFASDVGTKVQDNSNVARDQLSGQPTQTPKTEVTVKQN